MTLHSCRVPLVAPCAYNDLPDHTCQEEGSGYLQTRPHAKSTLVTQRAQCILYRPSKLKNTAGLLLWQEINEGKVVPPPNLLWKWSHPVLLDESQQVPGRRVLLPSSIIPSKDESLRPAFQTNIKMMVLCISVNCLGRTIQTWWWMQDIDSHWGDLCSDLSKLPCLAVNCWSVESSTSVEVGRGSSLHQWIYRLYKLTPWDNYNIRRSFSPGQIISQESLWYHSY